MLEQETAKGIDTLAAKTQEVMEQESRLPGGQALEYRLNPPAALVTGNQNGELSGRNGPYGIFDTPQPVGYDKGKEGGGNEVSPAGQSWGQPNRTNSGRPNAYEEYLAYKQKVQARQQSLALEQALRELVERVYAGPQAFAYNGANGGFTSDGYETGGAGGVDGNYGAGDSFKQGDLDSSAGAKRASSVGDTDGATGQILNEGEGGTTGNTGRGSKTDFKFSEITDDEIIEIVEEYRKKAPIEIPDNASVRAKSMSDGYEQITYKWNDGTYKYETRWHTRTSGAPIDQGNTWVVQRTKPGSGGVKPYTEFLSGDDWIPAYEWYEAIAARKAGTATKEQIDILDKGHWKE